MNSAKRIKLSEDVEDILSLIKTNVYFEIKEDIIEKIMESMEGMCGNIPDEVLSNLFEKGIIKYIVTLEISNEIIALAVCSESIQKEKKIIKLELLCSQKKRNTGRVIIEKAEKIAIENGYSIIVLASVPSAIGFYNHMGYISGKIETLDDNKMDIMSDIYKRSNLLLYNKEGNFEDIVSSNSDIVQVLQNLDFLDDEISYLIKNHDNVFSKFNETLKNYSIPDYFHEGNGNLLMIKKLY